MMKDCKNQGLYYTRN